MFFLTHLNKEYFINCTVFKSEENFKLFQTSQIKIEASSFYRLESEVISNNERQKALIVLSITYNKINYLFYAGYDININNFTSYGYLNENNCTLYSGYNYYIGNSYFKETEEFIVSAISQCTFNNISQYAYLIYSFDNNFEYYFYGILGDLVLGDSCCKSEAIKIYEKSINSILFSSVAQKYCIISNLNSSNIISSFIINKEINIINPTELKSTDSPPEYICENNLIFNDTNCPNKSSLIDDRIERNYYKKCTSEINYITSNFTCNNFINKTFEFSFNCSEKYPYEIVNSHKCVEHCNENDLLSGLFILNYHNSNIINITENIIIISTEIEYNDIITYSKETILETRNIESDSIISSGTNSITNSKDIILESENDWYIQQTITESIIKYFNIDLYYDSNGIHILLFIYSKLINNKNIDIISIYINLLKSYNKFIKSQ